MDPQWLALGVCTGMNVSLLTVLAVWLRRRVTRQRVRESLAKNLHTLACLMSGAFFGVALLWAVIQAFDLSVWHGGIYISSVLLNALVSVVAIFAGRIVIGWEPMRW